jgi:hypothetical protein
MNLGSFFFMLLSFTGAVVTVIGVTTAAIGYLKRQSTRAAAGQLSAEELDDLHARLADLEQSDARLAELEERLDFVERALGRSRDPKPLRNPAE